MTRRWWTHRASRAARAARHRPEERRDAAPGDRRRRGRPPGPVVAVAVVAVLLGSGGCAMDRQRADGVEGSVGQVARTESVAALNLVLVINKRGVARLIGTLINRADEQDRLVGVDLSADPPGRTIILADGPYVLPQDERVRLYRDARVTVIAEAFEPGYRADLTLLFDRSAPITTTVPVEANTGKYGDIQVMRPVDRSGQKKGG